MRKLLLLICLLAIPVASRAQGQFPGGGGGSGLPPGPTSPNGVTFTYCTTPSGGVAGLPTTCWVGVTVTDQVGTTYTLQPVDRGTCIEVTNSSGVTVTLPDVGGANFQFAYNGCIINSGTGTVTLTRTSSSSICVGANQS